MARLCSRLPNFDRGYFPVSATDARPARRVTGEVTKNDDARGSLAMAHPPCTEEAKLLLMLADQFFNAGSGNNEDGSRNDTRGRLVRNTPVRGSINRRR